VAEAFGLHGGSAAGTGTLLVWATDTGFPGIALRLVAFTELHLAQQARDTLAVLSFGLRPWDGAELTPLQTGTLEELMEQNFGPHLTDRQRRALIVVDPDVAELRELVLAHTVFASLDVGERQASAAEFVDAARNGFLQTLLTPDELSALADQRLRHHGERSPAAWYSEAEALRRVAVMFVQERAAADRHSAGARVA
jgi:hypothetical protein